MRLLIAIALAAFVAPAFAADAPVAANKAVNENCPLKGKPINADIAPIEATKADGTKVLIGVCCNGCAKKGKADPAALLAALEKAGK